MSSEVRKLATPSVKDRVSAEEWDTRVDLAACSRLAAHYRMTDLIYTHISARVPGPEHHFLINAFGLTWDEISASTLVKVTLEGEIVDDPYLGRACQSQIAAMAGGAKLNMPPREVAQKTAGQFANLPYKQKNTEWKAHLRMLDKTDSSYRM